MQESLFTQFQPFIDAAIGVVTFLAGFILKSIWQALSQLQKDMSKLQEAMAKDYVRRDDFQILAAELKATLIRIEHKLDSKVDKKV